MIHLGKCFCSPERNVNSAVAAVDKFLMIIKIKFFISPFLWYSDYIYVDYLILSQLYLDEHMEGNNTDIIRN